MYQLKQHEARSQTWAHALVLLLILIIRVRPSFLETEKWPIVELRTEMSSFEFIRKETVILQQNSWVQCSQANLRVFRIVKRAEKAMSKNTSPRAMLFNSGIWDENFVNEKKKRFHRIWYFVMFLSQLHLQKNSHRFIIRIKQYFRPVSLSFQPGKTTGSRK